MNWQIKTALIYAGFSLLLAPLIGWSVGKLDIPMIMVSYVLMAIFLAPTFTLLIWGCLRQS